MVSWYSIYSLLWLDKPIIVARLNVHHAFATARRGHFLLTSEVRDDERFPINITAAMKVTALTDAIMLYFVFTCSFWVILLELLFNKRSSLGLHQCPIRPCLRLRRSFRGNRLEEIAKRCNTLSSVESRDEAIPGKSLEEGHYYYLWLLVNIIPSINQTKAFM